MTTGTEHWAVRKARPGDEAGVLAVCRAVGTTIDADAVRRLLEHASAHVLVAESGGHIIGIAVAYELPRLDRRGADIYLHSIDTSEAFRRRGVARALIDGLRRIGRARGAEEMFLITNTSNAPAMGLYAATGGVREHDDEAMFVYPLNE